LDARTRDVSGERGSDVSGIGSVLAATGIPVAAASLGAVVSSTRTPPKPVQNAVQHLAAGLVFAAASAELVPDLLEHHEKVAVAIGFGIGIAFMLGVKKLGERSAGERSLVMTVAVDVFIDGLLIGIGISEGSKTGLLLAIALTGELAFLGLAVSAALGDQGASRRTVLTTTIGLAALIIPGGLIGFYALGGLTGAPLSAVLAFATVALLYLVTEELLVEAHETPDTAVSTSLFFVGFLALLLVHMAT